MANESAPFIDTWAPAQYVYASTGGQGPVRSPGGPDVIDQAVSAVSGDSGTYDQNLTYKIAGAIIISLVVIFVLQGTGFRFVGAVGIGR